MEDANRSILTNHQFDDEIKLFVKKNSNLDVIKLYTYQR